MEFFYFCKILKDKIQSGISDMKKPVLNQTNTPDLQRLGKNNFIG